LAAGLEPTSTKKAQPTRACGVVVREAGAGGVEAEAGELLEAPDTRRAGRLGLIGLDLRLDPLGLFHVF